MNSQKIRFLLLPFAVVFTFFLSALVSVLITKKLGVWEEPFAGFFTAFSVVISAYLISPGYKRSIAAVSFLLGASISWYMLVGSVYPQGHHLVGEPTNTPLLSTYAGGLSGLTLVLLRHYIVNLRKS